MNIWNFLLTNLLNGILGGALLLLFYFLFDKMTPKWDFTEVFREKGISGGAIIVAAFLLGLSIILSSATF